MIDRLGGAAAILLCAAISTSVAEAPSGVRRALVVGNATYGDFTLNGVEKSLDAVEGALQKNGFAVTRLENVDEKALKSAAETFATSVPTNGAAVVYFAGLGAHLERQGRLYNLLRPVGASIENENDYRSRSLSVADLLELLGERGGGRHNVLVLDACWESPVKPKTDAVRRGFREFETPLNTVVLFAAGSETSMPVPTNDEPSPLARAFAKHLGRFDASVTDGVSAIVADLDEPWVGGVTQTAFGVPSKLPITDTLREGRTPGEGFVNSVGMTFRWCPRGEFTMGSTKTDVPATRDRVPVKVSLSRGFWMGEHEVTQREYSIVVRKNVPTGFTTHPNAPYWGATEAKSVDDFCKRLTDHERKAGTLPKDWAYRCPTEAEWEYACRAGSSTAFCFGDSIAGSGGLRQSCGTPALSRENPDFHWSDQRADDGVGEALRKWVVINRTRGVFVTCTGTWPRSSPITSRRNCRAEPIR